ncbi:MAG: hypothetical protein AAF514_15910, partial [Verrucomicrobiota bacterium]
MKLFEVMRLTIINTIQGFLQAVLALVGGGLVCLGLWCQIFPPLPPAERVSIGELESLSIDQIPRFTCVESGRFHWAETMVGYREGLEGKENTSLLIPLASEETLATWGERADGGTLFVVHIPWAELEKDHPDLAGALERNAAGPLAMGFQVDQVLFRGGAFKAHYRQLNQIEREIVNNWEKGGFDQVLLVEMESPPLGFPFLGDSIIPGVMLVLASVVWFLAGRELGIKGAFLASRLASDFSQTGFFPVALDSVSGPTEKPDHELKKA